MKKISVVFVLLFIVGCYLPPAFRNALDPDEQVITYIDQHGKSQDAAFVSAHSWIAKNFYSAHDVIQMQDKAAGVLVVKGAYSFALPVNTFKTQFWHGYVAYTVSITIRDNKMKFEFITGSIQSPGLYGDGKYLPKNKIKKLFSHYKTIHDEILNEVVTTKSDF